MNNNILKTLIVGFLLFFSALFLEFDVVKAASCATNLKDENGNAIFTDGDQCYNNASKMDTGYALCYYYFDIPTRKEKKVYPKAPTLNREVQMYRHVDIQIQVTKNSSSKKVDTYYASSMTTRCSNEYEAGKDHGNMINDSNCRVKFPSITDEKKIFGKFQNADKWQCPSSIQITYGNMVNGNVSAANMQLQGNGTNTITAYLWKNASDNSKTVDYDKGKNVAVVAEGDEDKYANILNWGENNKEGKYSGYTSNDIGSPCSVITGEIKELITTVLWFIDIAAIILLIVMTIINFIQALTGMDDEKLRNTFKYFRTRIIVVVVLLLLPTIVGGVIDFINKAADGTVVVGEVKENGEPGEPFCSIDK